MLYVRLMHRYSVLYVLRTDTHTHTCNLPEAELYKHMTYTRADVRSCTRGQHLSSHRMGAQCSCTPSTTISSRRVDAHVSHTVTASYRHVRHGSHTCVLAWHALLGDTRCKTGKQTSVRCASARPPFVAASRVPPRTSWAAKLGSLSFKNGLSSWSRIWTKFLVQNLDQVLGVLYFTYDPRLGPFSGPRTWSRFWTKN